MTRAYPGTEESKPPTSGMFFKRYLGCLYTVKIFLVQTTISNDTQLHPLLVVQNSNIFLLIGMRQWWFVTRPWCCYIRFWRSETPFCLVIGMPELWFAIHLWWYYTNYRCFKKPKLRGLNHQWSQKTSLLLVFSTTTAFAKLQEVEIWSACQEISGSVQRWELK